MCKKNLIDIKYEFLLKALLADLNVNTLAH